MLTVVYRLCDGNAQRVTIHKDGHLPASDDELLTTEHKNVHWHVVLQKTTVCCEKCVLFVYWK